MPAQLQNCSAALPTSCPPAGNAACQCLRRTPKDKPHAPQAAACLMRSQPPSRSSAAARRTWHPPPKRCSKTAQTLAQATTPAAIFILACASMPWAPLSTAWHCMVACEHMAPPFWFSMITCARPCGSLRCLAHRQFLYSRMTALAWVRTAQHTSPWSSWQACAQCPTCCACARATQTKPQRPGARPCKIHAAPAACCSPARMCPCWTAPSAHPPAGCTKAPTCCATRRAPQCKSF